MKRIVLMMVVTMLMGTVTRGEKLVDITMVNVDRVVIGQFVYVDVFLGSDVPVTIGATHIVFTWLSDALELVGWDSGVWAIQGFWGDEFDDDWNYPCEGPPSPSNLCIPENDGTAVLTTVAAQYPVVDGPESVYVGTLVFFALATGESHIQIHQQLGEAVTDVAELFGDSDVDRRVRGVLVKVRG